MARKPRIHYPGALYHVMLRGNGGADIFFDDKDRFRFFLFLQQVIERYGCRVHAYCLMTNHAHLALQVGTIPLSRIMQNLSFRYTRWVNWRRQQTGHLFQGRYKAILIEEDEYLLQLIAYLHLNPIRAHMVENPEDYNWSSHRAYLGKETVPWLTSEQVLSRFSSRVQRARKQFVEFVSSQKGYGHRKEFHGGACKDSRILGEDNFLSEALRLADLEPLKSIDLVAAIKLIKGHFNCTDSDLKTPGQGRQMGRIRAYLSWAVLELSDATLTELGRWLNRDVSSLSSAVRRLKDKSKTSTALVAEMDTIKAQFEQLAISQA